MDLLHVPQKKTRQKEDPNPKQYEQTEDWHHGRASHHGYGKKKVGERLNDQAEEERDPIVTGTSPR